MSEERTPMSLPSVDAWRDEFMQAAVSYEEKRKTTPWWRRWFVGVILVVVLAGGGYATARVLDVFVTKHPEVPAFRGEIHAFVNLETGRPIRCPDGSLLIDKRNPGRLGPHYAKYPKCPDGSTPEIYIKQWEHLLEWGEKDHPKSVWHADHPYMGPRFEFQPALDENGNPLPEQAPPDQVLRRRSH